MSLIFYFSEPGGGFGDARQVLGAIAAGPLRLARPEDEEEPTRYLLCDLSQRKNTR